MAPVNIPDAFQEIISRLKDLKADADGKESKAPVIPLIDPTANVLSLVAAAITRQDDLRNAESQHQAEVRKVTQYYEDKLREERTRSDREAKIAEAGRINALLEANTNNVALALEKQGSQALAQDKRIGAVEQNQYQGVGASGQRVAGLQMNQWLIGLLIIIALAIANHFWK